MGPTTLNNMVNSLRLRVEMEAKKQGL